MSERTIFQFLVEIPAHDRQSALFLVESMREEAHRFIPEIQFKPVADPKAAFDMAMIRREAAKYRNDACPEGHCKNPRCGRAYRGPEPYCSLRCAVDDAMPLGEELQLSIGLEVVGVPKQVTSAAALERDLAEVQIGK